MNNIPHKELLKFIVDENTIAARDLFLSIIEKEGLWQKAFKNTFPLNEYKDCMLMWAFVQLCEKVKNGIIKNIKQLSSISGVIINTLHEAFREYKADILLTDKTENYDDYIVGVNPFKKINEEKQLIKEKEQLEELCKIVDDCLNKMGEICQSIIRYKYIEELDHKEIVQRVGKISSEGASRVRLYQCMEKLTEMCVKKLGK